MKDKTIGEQRAELEKGLKDALEVGGAQIASTITILLGMAIYVKLVTKEDLHQDAASQRRMMAGCLNSAREMGTLIMARLKAEGE